jgi:hypothetical protein
MSSGVKLESASRSGVMALPRPTRLRRLVVIPLVFGAHLGAIVAFWNPIRDLRKYGCHPILQP